VIGSEAQYEVPYHQVGLMMRADEQMWLEAGVEYGVEYSGDATNFLTFVTRDRRSDWSVITQ